MAWVVTQYVHLNPVRVQRLGLGKAARQREGQGRTMPTPEQVRERLEVLQSYRWSSYPWYAGRRAAPPWLTVREVLTGGRAAGLTEQQAAYRRATETAVGANLVLPPAVGGLLRGSAAWVGAMRRRLQGEATEQGALRHLAARPGWAQIRQAVEQVKGEPWEQFAQRHGDVGRDLALYVLRQEGGMSLRMAADCVGLRQYHTAAQALRRLRARLPTDKLLQRRIAEVVKCIKV